MNKSELFLKKMGKLSYRKFLEDLARNFRANFEQFNFLLLDVKSIRARSSFLKFKTIVLTYRLTSAFDHPATLSEVSFFLNN
jgi:hypothetical protein